MTYCKGHNCRYRDHCARYAIRLDAHETDNWIDHCVDAKRFVRAEHNRMNKQGKQ